VARTLLWDFAMTLIDFSPEQILCIGHDFWDELDKEERAHLIQSFVEPLKENFRAGTLSETLREVLGFGAAQPASWVHREGGLSPYWSLEVLAAAGAEHSDSPIWLELWDLGTDAQRLLMPYDYRALLLEAVVRHADTDLLSEHLSRRVSAPPSPLSLRSKKDFYLAPGDGIDHLFHVPESRLERLALVTSVARSMSERHVASLEARARTLVLGVAMDAAKGSVGPALVSKKAFVEIARDVGAELVDARDYLVPWAAEFEYSDRRYTLAEVLRIVAMTDIASQPDLELRTHCLSFYRSVLKLSGRAVIGLSAKVFHVEHGSRAEASIFYMGRDAILGKGLAVDVVGGFAVLTGAFLGGGYMPILIHTHKHLRGGRGEKASNERKKILPVCFVAKSGARLPMSYVGLWESADFLETPSPVEGILTYPVAEEGIS